MKKFKLWLKEHKKLIIGIALFSISFLGVIVALKKRQNSINLLNNKEKNVNKKVLSTKIIDNYNVIKEPRLTKKNIEKILILNEGFTHHTNYKGRNFEQSRVYTIKNGKLLIKECSSTSWSDSCKTRSFFADEEEIHRFLYNNLLSLDTNIEGK